MITFSRENSGILLRVYTPGARVEHESTNHAYGFLEFVRESERNADSMREREKKV